MASVRMATFNLENLDDGPGIEPLLADRIRVMRPQLLRVNADILCLQEVHSQGIAGTRTLAALDTLVTGTPYAGFNRAHTTTTGGQVFDVRNLLILSRFPIVPPIRQIRPSDGPRPSYQMATAIPPDTTASPVEWERPILYVQIDHIIVSRPLLRFFRGAEIHNEVLPDESGAFRTDVNFPESDHAPVVANFEL